MNLGRFGRAATSCWPSVCVGLLAVALASGCSAELTQGGGDSGSDGAPFDGAPFDGATSDAAVDIEPDAPADTTHDALADARPDTVMDATHDARADTTPDTKPDTTVDAMPADWGIPEGPYTGGVQHLSAYFVAAAWQQFQFNSYDEIDGHLTLAHVRPPDLPGFDGDTKAIVEVLFYLFCWNCETLSVLEPDELVRGVDRLRTDIGSHLSKVRMFYVFDEPYIQGMSRNDLEVASAALKRVFPHIPTYVVFAHHCFDPAHQDPAGTRSGPVQRGIPSNVDVVGFDWYTDDGRCMNPTTADLYPSDPQGIDPTRHDIYTSFTCHVDQGVKRLKQMTDKPIMLIAEGHDLTVKSEQEIIYAIDAAWDYAKHEPQVIGVDVFSWNVVSTIYNGVTAYPLVEQRILDIGDELACRTQGKCDSPSTGPPPSAGTFFKVWHVRPGASGWWGYLSRGGTYCATPGQYWGAHAPAPIGSSSIPIHSHPPDSRYYDGVCVDPP